MSIQPWKRIKQEPAYRGYRNIDRITYELPDGRTADFDVKMESKVVCVLALTDDNHVILAKQFRPGPEKIVLEIPGGVQDGDEDITAAAARELVEETGYVGNITFVGTSLIDGYSSGIRHNFVATNCKKVQEPVLDEFEGIEVVLMPVSEFRKHLRSGELTDVTTGYMALDYLGML